MALTDLTGTIWTLNDTLTSYAGGSYSKKAYNVNITTETPLEIYESATDAFVEIVIGYDNGGEHNEIRLYTSLPENYDNFYQVADGHDTKSLPDTWNSRYEGTFTITGGTDATNSDLIAWIEDNCTSATPPTPDVVVAYEGSNIVELFEAGTKTLKTAGKYLADDIALTYSGGGGGSSVETAHVVVESMADHGYYTDANMTMQDSTMVDDYLPIGTLFVLTYSFLMPEAEPEGLTLVRQVGSSAKDVTLIYEVTG